MAGHDTQGAQEGALKHGAQEVRSTFDTLQQRLKAVDGAVDNLTHHWKGQAFTSFQNLLEQWRTEVDGLNKILLDLEDALHGSESDQQVMEDEADATFADLTKMMA